MCHSFSVQKCCLVCEEVVEYTPSGGTVKAPEDIRDICVEMNLHIASDEVISMFTFNTRGKLMGYHEIAHGCVNGAEVHPREVFKRAFLENATAIALVHNHPSGDTEESAQDRDVTKRISEAGKLLGIPLIDHIIIAPDESFRSLKNTCCDLFA